jgi:predicted DNA-binding helix-hairpin-helix protein
MFYNLDMDTVEKLQTVATQMHLELAEEINPRAALRPPAPGPDGARVAPCGMVVGPQAKRSTLGIFPAKAPGGKTIPLLKTMLTTACERNCFYCPFRAGRNYRRVTVKPEEMARQFDRLYRAGLVEGLFLSSGIIRGGVRSQDLLLDTADILRHRYNFRGYLHLKIMPGVEQAQVERAMVLADRLSVNLEAPTSERLARLAPMKQLVEELVQPLRWIEDVRRRTPRPPVGRGSGYRPRRWPSTATQFVVGAVGDTDVELLRAGDYLYNRLHLRRTYFSAFSPIADTPLEGTAPTPKLREARLYQASFLLRDYGFTFEELPFDQEGLLPLDRDPKLAWAEEALRDRPVELNRAQREELLRVPGIGPLSADRIVEARRRGTLGELRHLEQVGVRGTGRLAPYVLLDGRRPTYQPRLL